jgi:hypothetical protein
VLECGDTGRLTPPASTRPRPLRQALSAPAEGFAHVRVVRDYPLLRQIGRLRYQQYIATQHKKYETMVLEPDCLIEGSDFVATNICASDAAGVTCAMRVGEIADDRHADYFRNVAETLGIALETALTCTRLVRRPSHSGRHAVDLIRFVRVQTVRAGWRYCIMQTAERLVPFFLKFEFFETGVWAHDPAAGRLQVLVLDTRLRPVQGE